MNFPFERKKSPPASAEADGGEQRRLGLRLTAYPGAPVQPQPLNPTPPALFSLNHKDLQNYEGAEGAEREGAELINSQGQFRRLAVRTCKSD